MLTLAVVVEKSDDFINNFYIGVTSALGLANFLGISAAFGDEINDVEHRALDLLFSMCSYDPSNN